MTQNSIKKIQEEIRRDGSLSEERKTVLLNLLATMKPERSELFTYQADSSTKTIRGGNRSPDETMRRNINMKFS
jgi:hypothetical protein